MYLAHTDSIKNGSKSTYNSELIQYRNNIEKNEQQFNDYIAIEFTKWSTQPIRRKLSDISEKAKDNSDSKL